MVLIQKISAQFLLQGFHQCESHNSMYLSRAWGHHCFVRGQINGRKSSSIFVFYKMVNAVNHHSPSDLGKNCCPLLLMTPRLTDDTLIYLRQGQTQIGDEKVLLYVWWKPLEDLGHNLWKQGNQVRDNVSPEFSDLESTRTGWTRFCLFKRHSRKQREVSN